MSEQATGRWLVVAGAVLVHLGAARAAALEPSEGAAIKGATQEIGQFHEGRPQGVPQSYDWYSRAVLKRGNDAAGNRALSGWGHVFWNVHARDVGEAVALRRLRVYLCSGSSARWRLVQSGDIYGREFQADFARNLSRAAAVSRIDADAVAVRFTPRYAFHFWPAMGRARLSDGPVCGVVVTVQARLSFPRGEGADGVPPLLIGLGADYWRDTSAVWDGGQSNPGIVVGRLRYVDDEWTWYAVNTASMENTMRLLKGGFDDAAAEH